MSVYPRNLSNFLNRMSGYNKNSVKMNVLGSSDAKSGDVIQVDLPTNSIVDLSSLAWSFDCEFNAKGLVHTKKARLPTNCESIIERLAIEVNGQTLVNMTNYNTLYHALLYMTATDDYIRHRRVGQTNHTTGEAGGFPEEIVGDNAADLAASAIKKRRHIIDTWLGFLGSAKPNFIDTSLLGNVRISITLAPGSIIHNVDSSDAALTSEFTLSSQYFSIDVVSISDGIYDAMVDQMLASGAPIEIPFKNYFAFQGSGGTGQLAFNVASQSIDRLWGLSRTTANHYSNAHIGAPAPVKNIGTQGITTTTTGDFTFNSSTQSDFQFQVNNTLYPQWSSTKEQDWYQHTKLALGDQGNMLAGSFVTCPAAYKENFFVYACQLEHRTDGDERFVSGIDTRGSAAQCYWNWKNPAADNTNLVFAECTSLLRVFSNKVLEVVQ